MEWKLELHGEDLEKIATSFVQAHLPYYELIWGAFIGHDGNYRMVEIPGIDPSINEKRKDFAESHYTILESLFMMYEVAQEQDEMISHAENYLEYKKMIISMIAFFAFAGRAKDNIRRCFTILGYPNNQPDPTSDIKSHYEVRHMVIHGKKIPLKVDQDGFYSIPILRSTDSPYGWDSDELWAEASAKEHQYVSDSLLQISLKMTSSVNKMLANLYEWVKDFKSQHNIVMPGPPVLNRTVDVIMNVSGVTKEGFMDVYGLWKQSRKEGSKKQ